MRWRWIPAAVALAACSSSSRTHAPDLGHRLAPPPKLDPGWATPLGSWLARESIVHVLAVDEHLAFAILGGTRGHMQAKSDAGTTIARIDLRTGEITGRAAVQAPDRLVRLVRDPDGRVIAFGGATGERAWAIDPRTLEPTELRVADPLAGSGLLRVEASADGTKVVTCISQVGGVVRDLKTLAVIRKLPQAFTCRATFPAPGKVAYVTDNGVETLELASGSVGPGSLTIGGPKGQYLARPGSFYRLYAADGREVGEIRRSELIFRGDGNGVVSVGPTVIVQPLDGPPKTFEVRGVIDAFAIPRSSSVVVQLGEYQLGVLDTATGTTRTRENYDVGPIRALAFRGDDVVTLSDRLRIWRDGKLVALGPATPSYGTPVLSTSRLDPIVASGENVMVAWSPPEEPRAVGEFYADAFDRMGDVVIEANASEARRGTLADQVLWWKPRPDANILAVDASRDEIIVAIRHATYAVRPAKDALVAMPCADGPVVRAALAHSTSSMAIASERSILRVDRDAGTLLGSIEEESSDKLLTFISDDELAIVEDPAHGGRVLLWSPGETLAWRSALPAPITSVAVDAEAKRLALGHADGSLEVRSLVTIRAEGKRVDKPTAPLGQCPAGAAIKSAADLAATQ